MPHTDSQSVPRHAGLKAGEVCYALYEPNRDAALDRRNDCPKGHKCAPKADNVDSVMTCQKKPGSCLQCIQSGGAWELSGVCSSCRNLKPCFSTEKMCLEYDVLHQAREVCEKQKSCDACHSADPDCRWAAGICAISQRPGMSFNTARGCPSVETRPLVAPATTATDCVECIDIGGIWQAGKCTLCRLHNSGFCYETKESCSLWDMRATAVELCPRQRSCSECLYSHPHCVWLVSTQSCIGDLGMYLNFGDDIRDTRHCASAEAQSVQKTNIGWKQSVLQDPVSASKILIKYHAATTNTNHCEGSMTLVTFAILFLSSLFM